MRIEDYWEDGTEFYVKFKSKDARIISKQLIVSPTTTEKEVVEIIHSCFNKVDKVIYIEELNDNVLIYKNNI